MSFLLFLFDSLIVGPRCARLIRAYQAFVREDALVRLRNQQAAVANPPRYLDRGL